MFFSEKQELCLKYLESDNNITEVFYGGAAGGGKSWLGCHWQIARRLHYPSTRGCIGRSQLKNLKKTTLKTFADVWRDYYADNPNGITYNLNLQDGIIYFSNKSEIVLQDLFHYPSDEDFTALGSLEITDAFIDEMPEISEKAFEILQSRIRYKLIDGTPKILGAGNPKSNWVKYRYVRTVEGADIKLKEYQAFVPATVFDNPNEDFKKAYIRQLEKINPYDKERLLHGNWDVTDNDNPFFYAYSNEKHYRTGITHTSGVYLDISFDFNKEPCTAVIGQYNHIDHTFKKFDVILGTPKTILNKSPLEAVCHQIKQKYIDTGFFTNLQIRVTGDASGSAGSADTKSQHSFYTTIAKELQLSSSQFYLRKANSTHVFSGELSNKVYRELHPNQFIIAHPMIEADITMAYPDKDRSLNEAKKELGLHILDAVRYLDDFWFCCRGGKFTSDMRVIGNYIENLKNEYIKRSV